MTTPTAHSSEPSKRFFISYCHEACHDPELAALLKAKLQARGDQVFIDSNIPVGSDWAQTIERKIGWCDHFIVLLSAESVQSEMVQGEIRLAHRRRGSDGRPRILPVRVAFDGGLGYELDSYLARTEYIRWQSEADSIRVLKALIAGAEAVEPAGGSDEAVHEAEPAAYAAERPLPAIDPRLLRAPGGTMRLDSRFYVRRQGDDRIEIAAGRGGETVVIKGPRQVGKSSLLVRYLTACKDAGRRVAFFDFQVLSDEQLDHYPTLLTQIATTAARRLRIPLDEPPAITNQIELTNFIEDRLVPEAGGPITLAFDEADRMLGRPHQTDFFSLLRHWHNHRAEPMVDFDVDLALAIATEPYLLIESGDRSPFNVTDPIELRPFSYAQMAELNRGHGGHLDDARLAQLHQLLGGQPFLTRLAYFRMLVDPKMSFEDLDDHAHDLAGPFGEHLRARLFWLGRKEGLLGALQQVIRNQTVADTDTQVRLQGAGLVREDGGKVVPASLLYARFFSRVRQ